MVPAWLTVVGALSIALAFACAIVIVVDIIGRGYRQRMRVMEVVWPMTALYGSVIALYAYFRWGRPRSRRVADERDHSSTGFENAAVGATHCGAGCALGDVIGAWIVFGATLTILGLALYAEYAVDFAIAYALGIVFQYFAIAPMRKLGLRRGVQAAVKADTLSLVSFEIGMFGWMAVVQLALFRNPHLTPDHVAYWLMMQIAMVLGFFTALPVNAWLIRRGIKEAM